jgi:signal peptidase I
MPQFRSMREDGTPVCSYPTWRETLPNGRSYDTLDMALTDRDNFGPVTVPEGFLFLMGDNRDNSQDSRVRELVGFVPEDMLVGRAQILFFSIDQTASFVKPWTWFTAIHYSRIFDSISPVRPPEQETTP